MPEHSARSAIQIIGYLTAQLSQMRPGVAPLLLPGQTRAEGVATLGPGDVALVVGLRRRPAGFTDMVKALAARGARIALLADGSLREAPAYADWTMPCMVAPPRFADPYAGAMAVLRLIVLETAKALGAAGRSHLEAVQTLRTDLGELE